MSELSDAKAELSELKAQIAGLELGFAACPPLSAQWVIVGCVLAITKGCARLAQLIAPWIADD
ncbi:MAG: hypothetical protein FWD08_00280 [Alphaproteobacteria bacterium]|nr:hypothetical protein [Alphaproteobacteria bacterium]